MELHRYVLQSTAEAVWHELTVCRVVHGTEWTERVTTSSSNYDA